ncbi:unnamed protein product [Rangifer tarandus platyrhynchus]|uniref:Uncharacterized protein n=1 Tax=Rangifer tarandus platyrhynchus TaxID=3082113 RepID=A0AC59Y3I7_RANTA
MINLVETLNQSIALSMADMWELEIPLLVKYLEGEMSRGFLYRSLGFPPATGLEADKVGVLLLERLYKTDHSDDFDREGFLYRALGFPPATGLEAGKVGVLLLEWLYKTDHSDYFDQEGVILCFGLCARGQVKTVLGVLHDFEEGIQESEQSWQIGAWWMEGYVRAEVASDTLVALSRNHFSLVMYELQHHLKPLNLTEESVIVTLAKLANGNAMETFCETVQFYLRHLEDSVYPVMTEDQFALKLFPMYRYFVTVWLRNNTPEVLRQILEMSFITNSPVPQMQLHIIFTELLSRCAPGPPPSSGSAARTWRRSCTAS